MLKHSSSKTFWDRNLIWCTACKYYKSIQHILQFLNTINSPTVTAMKNGESKIGWFCLVEDCIRKGVRTMRLSRRVLTIKNFYIFYSRWFFFATIFCLDNMMDIRFHSPGLVIIIIRMTLWAKGLLLPRWHCHHHNITKLSFLGVMWKVRWSP